MGEAIGPVYRHALSAVAHRRNCRGTRVGIGLVLDDIAARMAAFAEALYFLRLVCQKLIDGLLSAGVSARGQVIFVKNHVAPGD